jgi:hypothetical protein
MKFAAIENIRSRYKEWKDRRFLKKHHCRDWEQYHRAYDPDVCYGSSKIKSYYRGYPHVFVFNCGSEDPFLRGRDWEAEYVIIRDWAKQHCTGGKYRHDIHRVMLEYWSQEWEMNELGGGDHLFFAFKDDMDYFKFSLRWG